MASCLKQWKQKMWEKAFSPLNDMQFSCLFIILLFPFQLSFFSYLKSRLLLLCLRVHFRECIVETVTSQSKAQIHRWKSSHFPAGFVSYCTQLLILLFTLLSLICSDSVTLRITYFQFKWMLFDTSSNTQAEMLLDTLSSQLLWTYAHCAVELFHNRYLKGQISNF